ncbi:MAG TPA: ribosome silencing factor [Syntrophales bacterium]|nr:ribosome silencing factor [Syntrophales bacterium]HPX11275.1 ribosome silencing factor [Syntrophales bacterium]HQB29846.1 ribosome silencing factor [Syntrophales bacterium]HQN77234.1 ribosome silencing factor [Syntrophales bacterium]HQQ26238.1 ribosome silencing factor [Syntrophales bacterium]
MIRGKVRTEKGKREDGGSPAGKAKDLALLCVNAALERKAKDVVLLKVRELSSFADYFIICSGTSDRQVRSIADHIEERLKKEGVLPLGIEGRQGGQWILMDYGEVIFHVFYEATREFYDIERLWAEAPSLSVEPSVQKIDALGEELV